MLRSNPSEMNPCQVAGNKIVIQKSVVRFYTLAMNNPKMKSRKQFYLQ